MRTTVAVAGPVVTAMCCHGISEAKAFWRQRQLKRVRQKPGRAGNSLAAMTFLTQTGAYGSDVIDLSLSHGDEENSIQGLANRPTAPPSGRPAWSSLSPT